MHRIATFLTATAFALPLAGHAQNSIANGSSIGNWIVNCTAVSTTQTSCQVQQSLNVAETGALVVNFAAIPSGPDTAVLVAQLPMGVYLPAGAVFRSAGDGDAAQTEMVWQACSGRVCEAALQFTTAELEALAATETILFGYRMAPQADPIIVEVDVSDIARAVDALR